MEHLMLNVHTTFLGLGEKPAHTHNYLSFMICTLCNGDTHIFHAAYIN